MQEALRFLAPGAEPVDRADFVEQARLLRRDPERRPAAFADDPGLAQIVRRQRGAARHRPAYSGRPVRRHRRPQRLRQEHAAAADRRAGNHRPPARISFGEDARPEDVRRDVPGAAAAALGARAVNVEVGLGRERDRRPTRRRAPRSALAEVGLADKRDEWPAVLSGGQKQRVALARALVSQPRVLAFDEPLGALDALTRISMQRLLERVWHEQGFTAILVTHDVAEAVALADRVLVIEDGRIAHDVERRYPASAPARFGRTGGAGRRDPEKSSGRDGRYFRPVRYR